MTRRLIISVPFVIACLVSYACARKEVFEPEGRYRVESVFSTGKAWMEFKGEEFWYLTGTAEDRAERFTLSQGKILLGRFGGFEEVGFSVKTGRDGEILLYLDAESPGGRELLATIAGEEPGDSGAVNSTALAFNRALRRAIDGVFRDYPCMTLTR